MHGLTPQSKDLWRYFPFFIYIGVRPIAVDNVYDEWLVAEIVNSLDAEEFMIFGVERGGTIGLRMAAEFSAASDARLTRVIALEPDCTKVAAEYDELEKNNIPAVMIYFAGAKIPSVGNSRMITLDVQKGENVYE